MKDEAEKGRAEKDEIENVPVEVPLQSTKEVPVITQIKAPFIEPTVKHKIKSDKRR